MLNRRTAVSFLLVCALAAPAALAQERTASFTGFGGLSSNAFVTNSTAPSRIDFGFNVGKEVTPNVQITGEFGRIADTLPSLTTVLASLTTYDVRVPA